MNFALLTAIRSQGLRQWQLAARARVSESLVSKLINERDIPEKALAPAKKRIAQALGRRVDEIFPVHPHTTA